MARTEKELPINNISYQFVGTEEDLIKFLKAITFEYLTANYPANVKMKMYKNADSKCTILEKHF